MTRVTIRPEVPGDFSAITDVVAAAFGSPAEAALVERIRQSPEYVAATALVAEIDGEIVGHVMISGAVLEADHRRAIAMLSPLAVSPAHQGKGIGGDLVREATAIADARGEPIVVLEGDPRFYGRFGFEAAASYGIELPLPDWAPPDAAQVLRLSAFDPQDPSLRGTVSYPAAFDGLD